VIRLELMLTRGLDWSLFPLHLLTSTVNADTDQKPGEYLAMFLIWK